MSGRSSQSKCEKKIWRSKGLSHAEQCAPTSAVGEEQKKLLTRLTLLGSWWRVVHETQSHLCLFVSEQRSAKVEHYRSGLIFEQGCQHFTQPDN